MNQNKLLLYVAAAALIVSVAGAFVTYLSVSQLATTISGFATSTGQANLTVESVVQVNFTTNFVSWGSGRVNPGQSLAQLTTLETNNVTNGNWTLTVPGGFRLENIGNTNVTLDLLAGKTAAQFLGGTGPVYQWNVSNVEATSCANNQTTLMTWFNVNITSPGTRFCGNFTYYNAADLIRIDINLTVPYDSISGALTDTITATATAA